MNIVNFILLILLIILIFILFFQNRKRFKTLEKNINKTYDKILDFNLKELSEGDRQSFIYQKMLKIRKVLNVKKVEDYNLIRIGRLYDGGYLMLNHFNPKQIAYSFGINDDVSWDKDMSTRQIHCYMYDHTIHQLPVGEENQFFHWSKTGVCGNTPQKDCKTIKQLLEINGHINKNDLILKMDVEGAEWDVLDDIDFSILKQFDQIVIELHHICNLSNYERMIRCLNKLQTTHQAIWVHGNNYSDYLKVGNLITPDTLEVLFANKEKYQFTQNNNQFPLAQDFPNNPEKLDIYLGKWNVD